MTIRVSVVGHVEWVDFVPLECLPHAGEVAHAAGAFTRAAGGGGVASAVLTGLAEEVDFFCALGGDADGHAAADQLRARGVNVQAAIREQPTRRAVTILQPRGERTIITIGDRLEPHGEDALEWDRLDGAAGVYLTAGDPGAGLHARRAPVLVATPRARHALADERVRLDALVFSAEDANEVAWARPVFDRTRLVVATEGATGGRWWGETEGRWSAVAPPGPPCDTYGCGDSFAAALTFGLASGLAIADAAALGARLGAAALAVPGAP